MLFEATRTRKHKYPYIVVSTVWANRLKQYTKDFDPKRWEFLWVTDFHSSNGVSREKQWVSAQHPFTGIVEEDLDKLETAPWECRSKGYDLVLNGVELGSGSIRIHRQDVQARMFKALGLSDEQARQRFGFSSTRSPMGRRRTAESRWASIAS